MHFFLFNFSRDDVFLSHIISHSVYFYTLTTDMVTQLKDTTADSLLTTRDHQERTHSPSETSTSTFEPQPTFTTHLFKSTHSTLSPSPSLSSPLSLSTSSSLHPSPSSLETEVELSQSMSSTQASIGGMRHLYCHLMKCLLYTKSFWYHIDNKMVIRWDKNPSSLVFKLSVNAFLLMSFPSCASLFQHRQRHCLSPQPVLFSYLQ